MRRGPTGLVAVLAVPLLAVPLLAVPLLAGCSEGADGPVPAGNGAAGTAVTVGGVRLQVEVADSEAERVAGLRGRRVPPGTGMLFRYDGARPVRFTMSRVSEPLVAVFVRAGSVVSVEQLVPCAGSVDECPTYGPDEPVDSVVEAAPAALPAAAPGDAVTVAP